MSDFQDYVRKQFPATAARITPMNIEELAKQCDGEVIESEKEGNLSRNAIRFKSTYTNGVRVLTAHVGDWLVKSGRNYRVYGDKAFQRTFEKPKSSKPSPKSMPPKRPIPDGIELKENFEGVLTDVRPKN